ncbi:homocitrate synthase [Flammeovirgaceae bacterium SG7u.111]|nr:hypothetical protein [Flammeovirgaceae bacterium SG7u.132]WPO37580.1 homocitrate synthase [Flammeovirgaceae bacterium SG7u.111]
MKKLNPYIIDTTLRDGEQTPGVAFSIDEKMKIAAMLDELGIDEVEAGTPVIGEEEQEAISTIAQAGFCFKTSSWCRAKTEDIVQAARLGAQCINISLPVSSIQMETLGKDRRWVMGQLKETLALAKGLFPHVTMGAQDASRAEPEFLQHYIWNAIDAGADRIRIADTVGILDPIETFEFISGLKKLFSFQPIEFHGHNDYGMATANAVAAMKAGADCISATVNGLGERAGNSALEELIAYLYSKQGADRFCTKILNQLCRYVAALSDSAIPKQKAITGGNAFRHESGIHTSAILRNVKSYQVINPADFGVEGTRIALGKHSGKASFEAFSQRNIERWNEIQLTEPFFSGE